VTRPVPAVSVVIPCYRGERFVADAIGSVLSQSEQALEVIVVDDGSPDRSAEMAAAIADQRIRVVRHAHNRGIAAARNTGLTESRAELVAFLDQDDLWLPGLVAAGLQAFRTRGAEKYVLAFCDTYERDRKGRDRLLRPALPRDMDAPQSVLAALVREKFVVLGAALVRRTVLVEIGGFDEHIRGGSDDFDVLVRLAERGGFAHVPGARFVRRLHAENYTSAELMIGESLAVIDRAASRHPWLGPAARRGRARKLYRRASDALAAGLPGRAREDYLRSLHERPWQPRAWLGLALAATGRVGSAALGLWRRVRRM
jgi:glycosyltransferase involved in cell wall biosynthesis